MMEAGRIVAFGPVDEICDRYYASVHGLGVQSERSDPSEGLIRGIGLADRQARGNGAARFNKVVARDVTTATRWRYSPERP